YDALFAKYNVYRARTTEELLDVAYAASQGKFPRGPRVGIISISGGIGVQIADYLSDARLEMPQPSPEIQQALKAIVPACSPKNPIDMTGQITTDADIMEQTAELILSSG